MGRGKHPPCLVNSPAAIFPVGFLWRAHFPVEPLYRFGALCGGQQVLSFSLLGVHRQQE